MAATESDLTDRIRHIIGADETMVEKLADQLGDFAVSLIAAGFILVATFWLAGWASRLVRKLMARLEGRGPVDATLLSFTSSLARYVVIVMGLIAGWFAFKGQDSSHWRLFLTTGILGGYTTFSAFSLDAALLYERGALGLSALYVIASVALSIAGLFAGLWLIRHLA